MEFTIRPMSPATALQVAELEEICFADPWSAESLLMELASPNSLYLTALCGDRLAGYAGFRHVLDEGHITNVAAAPEFRRLGVARRLMEEMIATAQRIELSFLTLEVRSSNEAAIALYSGLGFERVGTRPRYYLHPVEDAILMTLFL